MISVAGQRTNQVRVDASSVAYAYDNLGQLKAATGKESGGATRLNEQFGYGYDAAQNLNQRTNNALVQTFNVNAKNELTTATRAGTLTVAGTTTASATSVTVNGSPTIERSPCLEPRSSMGIIHSPPLPRIRSAVKTRTSSQ